jgi:hypothetical protein
MQRHAATFERYRPSGMSVGAVEHRRARRTAAPFDRSALIPDLMTSASIPNVTIVRRAPPMDTHVLRDHLLATVDLLQRRQASLIEPGYIERYVTLDWLEWHAGALRLTTTGENMCKQLVEGLSAATSPSTA